MKSIFTFCVLLISCIQFGIAQSNTFNQLEKKIEGYIAKNLWDEVLVLAPDLLIEEPTRGEGFYYTALAFFKMEEKTSAEKYLTKAEALADVELQAKIDILKQNIQLGEQANELVQNALDSEARGAIADAAEEWRTAWEVDKQNFDYGLKAVEHYLTLKKYPEALAILEDPSVPDDEAKRKLIRRINGTSTMKDINNFEDAKRNADRYFENGDFEEALDYYKRAERIKKYDSYILQRKAETIDEMAWQKAVNSKYVEETERYVDDFPNGKYLDRANRLIRKSYISISRKALLNQNEKVIVKYHNKFLDRFPGDNGILEIKTMLGQYYYTNAEKNLNNKRWYTAKSFYEAYLTVYSSGAKAKSSKKAIKKCDRKIRQRNAGFLMYTYDRESSIGLSFGNLKKNKAGFYMNIKMNNDIFTGLDILYKTDDNRNNDSPYDVIQQTGEIKLANLSTSLGITFKFGYPFYAYLGGGATYLPVYEEYDGYSIRFDGSRTEGSVDYYTNTDKTSWEFFPEGGLMLKLGNALLLKYGVMYREEIFHQFGVGFQIR